MINFVVVSGFLVLNASLSHNW